MSKYNICFIAALSGIIGGLAGSCINQPANAWIPSISESAARMAVALENIAKSLEQAK